MWVFFSWVASAFVSLSGWVATYFAVETAVKVSAIVLCLSLTVAITGTLYALVSSLVLFTTPTGWYAFGMSLVPTNLIGCFSVYLSAHFSAYLYEYQYGQVLKHMKLVS